MILIDVIYPQRINCCNLIRVSLSRLFKSRRRFLLLLLFNDGVVITKIVSVTLLPYPDLGLELLA